MNCGFIGLGMLGAKMAEKILQAGHSLQVYDQDSKAVEQLVAAGATGAGSVQDTTNHIDTLITCLPSPAICAQVMTGVGGALQALSAGSCWIEMSTTDADEMKRLALLARERGIDVLECPATGGVHRAVTGQMTLLVGGDESVEVLWAHLVVLHQNHSLARQLDDCTFDCLPSFSFLGNRGVRHSSRVP